MASSSTWVPSTFHCANADFVVRSVPDNTRFPVNRAAMQTSVVFRDMFSLGETVAKEDEIVDVFETSQTLTILLHLLHSPPQLPTVLPREDKSEDQRSTSRRPRDVSYDPVTVIPLPILWVVLNLADKYMLSDLVTETLHVHLLAHAPAYPMPVYAYAVNHGLDRLAATASEYLMPIASYGWDDIKLIPNVEAYHKIVRLQDLRVKELRKLVLSEELFPHGYGLCSSHHQETSFLWERKRKELAYQIESVTDVAGEMNTLADALPKDCQPCQKACIAAVTMLAYKSWKTLRRIDQLPAEH